MAKKPSKEILDSIETSIGNQVLYRKDVPSDNFDFHELTQDITKSITDQLYRFYQPKLAEKYLKKVEAGQNEDVSNDLVVDEIVQAVYKSLPDKISQAVTNSITDRVKTELEEQYQAKDKTLEHRRDALLRGLRHLITPAYFFASFVLLFLSALVALEAWEVVEHTSKLFAWVFWPESWKFNLSYSDQNFGTRFYLNQIVATILSILDLLLLAALVVMVLIGGFENTVGRIGKSHSVPTWFGKLGITELKIKVAGSIVIISSIHLLTFFMLLDVTERKLVAPVAKGGVTDALATLKTQAYSNFEQLIGAYDYDYDALMWTAIVHGVFVVSALVLSYMSRLGGEGH